MNLEEVQSLFSSRIGIFDPISGRPNNTYLTQLHEDLTVALLPLSYDVEKLIHNRMGLVLDEDDYKN